MSDQGLKERIRYLEGQVDGLRVAVNVLTASKPAVVESKSPAPKPPIIGPELASLASYGVNQHYFQKGVRAGYDEGWNAALNRVLNHPDGANYSTERIARLLVSLKKEPTC